MRWWRRRKPVVSTSRRPAWLRLPGLAPAIEPGVGTFAVDTSMTVVDRRMGVESRAIAASGPAGRVTGLATASPMVLEPLVIPAHQRRFVARARGTLTKVSPAAVRPPVSPEQPWRPSSFLHDAYRMKDQVMAVEPAPPRRRQTGHGLGPTAKMYRSGAMPVPEPVEVPSVSPVLTPRARYVTDGLHFARDEHTVPPAEVMLDGEVTERPVPTVVSERLATVLGVHTSGVTVRRGPAVDRAAEALGARGFTVGEVPHVPDSMGPLESGPGAAVLAHELTHVVQQRVTGAADEAEAVRVEEWFTGSGPEPDPVWAPDEQSGVSSAESPVSGSDAPRSEDEPAADLMIPPAGVSGVAISPAVGGPSVSPGVVGVPEVVVSPAVVESSGPVGGSTGAAVSPGVADLSVVSVSGVVTAPAVGESVGAVGEPWVSPGVGDVAGVPAVGGAGVVGASEVVVPSAGIPAVVVSPGVAGVAASPGLGVVSVSGVATTPAVGASVGAVGRPSISPGVGDVAGVPAAGGAGVVGVREEVVAGPGVVALPALDESAGAVGGPVAAVVSSGVGVAGPGVVAVAGTTASPLSTTRREANVVAPALGAVGSPAAMERLSTMAESRSVASSPARSAPAFSLQPEPVRTNGVDDFMSWLATTDDDEPPPTDTATEPEPNHEQLLLDAIEHLGDEPPRRWLDLDDVDHFVEIANRIYAELSVRLRFDLMVERERSGSLMDRS